MIEEEWRDIEGFEGQYQVSNLGRVKSLSRYVNTRGNGKRLVKERILKTEFESVPYSAAILTGKTFFRVHVLVAKAFLGDRPEGLDICHRDGNPHNNSVDNLRYDTTSSNILDAITHGTHKETRKTQCPLGHELTPENNVNNFKDRGVRTCLACNRARAYFNNRGFSRDMYEDIIKEVSDLCFEHGTSYKYLIDNGLYIERVLK